MGNMTGMRHPIIIYIKHIITGWLYLIQQDVQF